MEELFAITQIMCVEYELRMAVVRPGPLYRQENMPFIWNDPTPEIDALYPRIKITNPGVIVRLRNNRLVGEMMTWGRVEQRWIIFNAKSEKRDFSQDQRILILATGYYECTEPLEPRIAGHEQHFFTMRGEQWFSIAGIVRNNCFLMLTTKAGPDIRPYCKRQVCVMAPSNGLDWLTLSRPQTELLKPSRSGTIAVRTSCRRETFVHEVLPRRYSH